MRLRDSARLVKMTEPGLLGLEKKPRRGLEMMGQSGASMKPTVAAADQCRLLLAPHQN